MCELCTQEPSPQTRSKRLRIWEVDSARHCSIVGTCLTLDEIRGLARKLGYKNNSSNDTDFYLHGHFVRKAGDNSIAAKLLNKLLDRKYASAIRRFKAARTTRELADLWQQACAAGDIPGAYWAVLTHPHLDESLAIRVYGDVHMLSHLVGACNRADRTALRRMEQEVAPIEQALKKTATRHRQMLEAKQHLIDDLQNEVIALKAMLAGAKDRDRAQPGQPAAGRRDSPPVKAEQDSLNQELAALASANKKLQERNSQLSEMVLRLEAETRAIDTDSDGDESPSEGENDHLDLQGHCILYVGGRAPQVCRFRDMVARWNGELLHHDGGREMSMAELARAVGKADAVVFPTDCVSHSAALKVKRLCRQSMKPYLPLRTSGAASLIAGLRSQFDDLSAQESIN
ncbi:MAG: DUF2325 domain-containing protein [Rhodospirillales bacterium]|nr:DUF2325 domain-containing protein [Rhodospirillales bacterium]